MSIKTECLKIDDAKIEKLVDVEDFPEYMTLLYKQFEINNPKLFVANNFAIKSWQSWWLLFYMPDDVFRDFADKCAAKYTDAHERHVFLRHLITFWHTMGPTNNIHAHNSVMRTKMAKDFLKTVKNEP